MGENKTNCPCYDCKTRHVGCHGTCSKYSAWKKKDKLRSKREKEALREHNPWHDWNSMRKW